MCIKCREYVPKLPAYLLWKIEKHWTFNSKAFKSHLKIFERFSPGRLEKRKTWETLRNFKKPDVCHCTKKKLAVIWCSVTWRGRFKSAIWIYLSQGWTPPSIDINSLFVFVCHPRRRGQLCTSVLEIPGTKCTSLAPRLGKHSSHQPIWYVSCGHLRYECIYCKNHRALQNAIN